MINRVTPIAYANTAAQNAIKSVVQFAANSHASSRLQFDGAGTKEQVPAYIENLMTDFASGIDSMGVPTKDIHLTPDEKRAFEAILSDIRNQSHLIQAVVTVVENPSGPFAGYPMVQSDLKSLIIQALLKRISA